MKKLLLGVICVVGLMVGIVQAEVNIPDIHLALSFRQLEDGKLSEGVHLFELWCEDGRCDLTLLTLNQCLEGRFFPQVERFSTGILAGNGKRATLSVKHSHDNIFTIESDSGMVDDTKMTFVIKYRQAKTDAEKYQTFNRRFTHTAEGIKKIVLADFKGGFTKYSRALDKLITVEYALITDEKYPSIKMNCAVLVTGTTSLKKKE